jgi:NAD(P)-dependent dehydrogenase (short-subunit alcohol dehydrogenase family)
MKDLAGKVAVVTGGASGIGRAMADRFAAEGMSLVIADIEQGALDRAAAEMHSAGATVLAVQTDVSRGTDVMALAGAAYDRFGAVHVLCNNAGVPPVVSPSWELAETDWQWVLGVNLWGVLHGIRAFVPRMIEQGEEAHVVNTSSVAGLVTAPWAATYVVAKHGVVALSECLHKELETIGSPVKVSVLCPAWVKTDLMSGDRNRPAGLAAPQQRTERPQAAVMEQVFRGSVEAGTDPADLANIVVEAIRDERFYILPHPQWKEQILGRVEDIVNERNPGVEAAAA